MAWPEQSSLWLRTDQSFWTERMSQLIFMIVMKKRTEWDQTSACGHCSLSYLSKNDRTLSHSETYCFTRPYIMQTLTFKSENMMKTMHILFNTDGILWTNCSGNKKEIWNFIFWINIVLFCEFFLFYIYTVYILYWNFKKLP